MSSKPLNRKSLKLLFGDGTRPNEKNFGSLIDSMLNKADDGISKNFNDGLTLAPMGAESDRVISFKEKIKDSNALWSIDLIDTKTANGLLIGEPEAINNKRTSLFLQKGGNIGIGTQSPQTRLDVAGVFGSHSRVGTYVLGSVPADGKWHDIPTPETLDGYNAFEILAQVGKAKSGKHALLHATALSTFGRSRHRIRRTQAYFGWWWNRIAIRWTGDTNNYKLQLKTRTNYGTDIKIKFHVTKLWDNEIMNLFTEKE